MSKISLQPNASGTGTFTLAAPNSNTNRTLTLPDEAGKVLTDASDIAANKLTGDIAADRMKDGFNASGAAPIYACRAWVNFNGTGTVAIRESGNVSSITDNRTGDYTVNFSQSLPTSSFAAAGIDDRVGALDAEHRRLSLIGNRIYSIQPGGGLVDTSNVRVAFFA